MGAKDFKRRRKLIKPGLQLRLSGAFAMVATLALLLQFLLLGYFVLDAAQEIDGAGGVLASQVPSVLLFTFGLSLLVLLPLLLIAGVLLTFRFAGPAYRFEQYLLAIARGEELGPCRIRKGDELQFLCDAINLATEPMRQARSETASSGESAGSQHRASA